MSDSSTKKINWFQDVKVLKDTPISFDEPDMAAYLFRQREKYGNSSASEIFPSLKLGPFPGCCGVAVIYGMNDIRRSVNAPNSTLEHSRLSKDSYLVDPVYHTKAVGGIARALASWEVHKQAKNYGPLLLCTINDQQLYAGLNVILEEYFGFVQIYKDFKNKDAAEARVRLYSLMI